MIDIINEAQSKVSNLIYRPSKTEYHPIDSLPPEEELANYHIGCDSEPLTLNELMIELGQMQVRFSELYESYGVIAIDDDQVHLTLETFYKFFGCNYDVVPAITHDDVELLTSTFREVEFMAIRYR